MKYYRVIIPFFLISCAGVSVDYPMRSLASIPEGLSCKSSLKSFAVKDVDYIKSIKVADISDILENSEYEEIISLYPTQVEKEEMAAILLHLEREFPDEEVAKRKSRFWELFHCQI